MEEIVSCACGCGTQFKALDNRNRRRRYIKGHGTKGTIHPWMAERKGVLLRHLWKKKPLWRVRHYRARKLAMRSECQLSPLGYCQGRVEVNHINKHTYDNRLKNLIALCRTHHRLMDLGKIDPYNPRMPRFYVDSGGTRRYETKEGKLYPNFGKPHLGGNSIIPFEWWKKPKSPIPMEHT